MKKTLFIAALLGSAVFGAHAQHLTQPGAEFLLVYDARGNVVRVLESKVVTPESLTGEWCWVGKNVPELILVLDTDDEGGLLINDLYTYRFESYKNPKYSFDGETLHIRADVDENAYIELDLKPDGDNLKGRCTMIGLLRVDFDDEITLRRDYFEYDKR